MALEKEWLPLMAEKSFLEEEQREENHYLFPIKCLKNNQIWSTKILP